jgi:hypothetical protein
MFDLIEQNGCMCSQLRAGLISIHHVMEVSNSSPLKSEQFSSRFKNTKGVSRSASKILPFRPLSCSKFPFNVFFETTKLPGSSWMYIYGTSKKEHMFPTSMLIHNTDGKKNIIPLERKIRKTTNFRGHLFKVTCFRKQRH